MLLAASLAATAGAETSTLGNGASYAWAGNLGWLQLKPERPSAGEGVRVTDTHLGGFAWSDSVGWINFGSGTPIDGVRYSNADASDFGVNHDGLGNLSGLAWSANLGWINFGWADVTNLDRPRFSLIDGNFSGFAWSANAGWVNLGTGILRTVSMAIVDTDGDGISDAWELSRTVPGSDVPATLGTLSASGDADGDGVPDRLEYLSDANPFDPNDRLRIVNYVGTVVSFPRLAVDWQITWTSRPTRFYYVETSTDLVDWTASALIVPDAGTSTTRTFSHGLTTRRFFRVRPVLPLQP